MTQKIQDFYYKEQVIDVFACKTEYIVIEPFNQSQEDDLFEYSM